MDLTVPVASARPYSIGVLARLAGMLRVSAALLAAAATSATLLIAADPSNTLFGSRGCRHCSTANRYQRTDLYGVTRPEPAADFVPHPLFNQSKVHKQSNGRVVEMEVFLPGNCVL